jgi:hypothetical protein
MNREKLEELRRWFQQDESEPGSKADAQLLVAHMLELIDALLEDDDAGCPPWPKPRIDRSSRGWVHITDDDGDVFILEARENGVYDRAFLAWTWDILEEKSWTVRKLTSEDIEYKPRSLAEWTEAEKAGVRDLLREHFNSKQVAKVIEIATRQTHE